ncbi:hypothetical protein TSUD_210320 [Trifolium subterraneum]|uniref:pectinesterase n=1 Tax=Trifolium subterraneum TaxID=3900 RepID=A0A2Z6ND43_TRISU|nr:hypothetical protein TSUD_210320 [Trifolium subterraneum]
MIYADKCAFYDCAFYGVQDTLYDTYGRHYYHNCYIQGGIDFVFGNGQSIFEASTLNFSMGVYGPKLGTKETAILGRSLDAYSRVIVANSYLTNVVSPEGWYARTYVGHEETITFVEAGNSGPGANQSQRVKWMKHLSGAELDRFLNISFIDKEGWINKLPVNN